jgi:hypothetical protein
VEKNFPRKWTHKQIGVPTPISEKVDCRLKGTIHQEEVSILNVYAPNSEALNYIKKIL